MCTAHVVRTAHVARATHLRPARPGPVSPSAAHCCCFCFCCRSRWQSQLAAVRSASPSAANELVAATSLAATGRQASVPRGWQPESAQQALQPQLAPEIRQRRGVRRRAIQRECDDAVDAASAESWFPPPAALAGIRRASLCARSCNCRRRARTHSYSGRRFLRHDLLRIIVTPDLKTSAARTVVRSASAESDICERPYGTICPAQLAVTTTPCWRSFVTACLTAIPGSAACLKQLHLDPGNVGGSLQV
jgi:hypothetical protein